MFKYTYPGMNEMCDCSANTDGIDLIHGQCPPEKEQCQNIPFMESDSGYDMLGKAICGAKLKHMNYYNVSRPDLEGKCPNGT
jgi:hypothetical protein